jgi:hypothetical protein
VLKTDKLVKTVNPAVNIVNGTVLAEKMIYIFYMVFFS